MAAGHQLRLLLWKDYLIRKRKWITLAGVTWAVAVLLTLYIVRINIDNQDFPTCQFPARALPSAGLLTFVQSFVCSVNNDCSPMDRFQEIPTYENSKLTQLQRQFSPLLYNETVLDVASTVPDALKLLATLADVVDQPTFVDISKNGLKVGDVFLNPKRVKRYLMSELNLSEDVAESVMTSELKFQGLFKGSIDRCNSNSISNIVSILNTEHQEIFVQKLCSLSNANIQKMAIKLILEVNFEKYVAMIGDMYFKLAGDKRLIQLGDMMAAILRMIKFESFLPREIVTVFLNDDVDFNYFNLTIIPKLMDLFEPTFGDTQSYKTLRDFTDAAVTGLQYLNRIVRRPTNSVIDELRTTNANKMYPMNTQLATEALKNAIAVFEESNANDSSIGVFNVLAQITKIIYKFLPEKMKSDVSFYSTLLAKLMEGALKVIDINMHIQEMAYNVSLRNTEGVKVFVGLPSHVIGKGFEALADAERTQILTSKLNIPGQMFCDSSRIANFFLISKTEADSLKKKLCTDAWKSYMADLIQSFGIYEVKDNINTMASLVVQNTVGKDISDQVYSIDKIFNVLKNFTSGLTVIRSYKEPPVDWQKIFNLTDDSSFMKVVREKGHLGKQMLITVHGALAKEVVKQNPLLEYKISPKLIDITTIVGAINDQLSFMSMDLVTRLKKLYPEIIQTMLMTTLDEQKTYKSLSTPSADVVCNGSENASSYLVLSTNIDDDSLLSALCDTATVIDNGLKNDSVLAKAILKVMNRTRVTESVNWTKLINNVKSLYMKLNTDFPYLFDYKTYGMDGETQTKVNQMLEEAKEFWFSWSHIERSLHLSVKLLFRLLDLTDSAIFNIKDGMWVKIKQALGTASGPMSIVNDIIMEVTALVNNETYTSRLPSKTSLALSAIVPNVPQLIVDSVNVIINDNTDIEPIITLMNSVPEWPCSSTSISEYIQLSENSKTAVKGFETLICMDTELQQQWKDYIDVKNVSATSPHVFLKFSAAFDYLIDDVIVLRRTLNGIFNDTDSSDDHLTLVSAWKYAVDAINNTDSVDTFGKLFSKIDTVLTSVNTLILESQSTYALWEKFMKCSNGSLIDEECKAVGRSAWRYSLESLSVMLENMADDLMTYFREINEPNSNVLQMLGFTRRTGLYILYDKLPEFVGTLINSYWDYGFMSQIRRASLSEFWDCEAVVNSLLPLPGSGIDTSTLLKIQPIVCPSLLYWISLPRGDNTLLDVFAKPQYFFYTLPVQNLTSRYKNAFTKATELANLLTDLANKNETLITEEDVRINNVEDKLRRTVDAILTYRINATDQSYRLFHEINTKQFYAIIYLSRIVSSINKMSVAMDNITATDIKSDISEADLKKLGSELSSIQKIFKRRPSDAVALFFDVITDVVWTNNDDYKLTNALNAMCEDLNNNNTNKDILNEGNRTKQQICAKNYKLIYGAVENVLMEDKEQTRQSLLNLKNILLNGNDREVNDIFAFLNQRKQLTKSLKYSIKYAYDLGIPIYLKYLQNNLENYNIVLSFLAGKDWWSELRTLYIGPHVTTFFNAVENSYEIAENILTNLDKIHLVRLLRDIEVNSSTAFCRPNITLSDYIPDGTGVLSEIKRQACETDKHEVFKEIPLLVFASQGFATDLKLSKDVDYSALNAVITKTESTLELIKDGPKPPERPSWMTDEKIAGLRTVASQLLSKESITKIAFGMTGNVVDAGTLFLNGSNCVLCSELTTWFKQINLQLIKKQEYDNLLCHMRSMTLEDIHHALKNDFHWDITVGELISSRNYTKYEMNKSVGELLEQVKLHLLEDLTANTTKLAECLARNVSRNEFGNATLFMTVLSQTARLIRAELPYFHEVEGMKDVPYLKKLSTEIAHKLDALVPLKKYMMKKNLLRELEEVVGGNFVKAIEESDINLRAISTYQHTPIEKYIFLSNQKWNDICKQYNCDDISNFINESLNKTLTAMDLPRLQEDKFWRFGFVSNIIQHSEVMVGHLARLLGLASKVDVAGATQGHLAALIDLAMQILNDDILSGIVFSIQGIVAELRPLLHQTQLEHDLEALSDGLLVLQQFKTDLQENNDLKVEVSSLFREPERVETSLGRLGINNTNFWSIAAPRIHAGHLMLQPVFTVKDDDYHISKFVCQPEWMSKVVAPSNLDVVTAEDVFAAVAEQFCPLSDERAKQVLVALMENLNTSFIIEKVKNFLLSKLYAASNLDQSQGSAVLDGLPQIAALLPTIQASVGDLSDTLSEEPLFQSLKNFSSVGNLISSSDFMSSAGNMLCGKPFYADISRLYKTVLQSEDMSDQPNKAQLDALPTDFCRSLYTDIINVEGGKIVWSFIKPLIMGRILYTPNTPLVQKIVEKANGTFSHMSKLTGLVHSFARAFSSVDKLFQHRAGVSVLRTIISSPAFSELKSSLIGDQQLPDMDVDGLFDEFGDLKGVGGLLTKASDVLQCINMDRFKVMPDEYELTHAAARLSMVNEFSAGLVFLNTEEQGGVPTNIEYKIRMDIDNVPTTNRLKNYMWTPGPEASFLENMRYFRGFVQIQDMIDRAIINLSKNTSRIQKRDTSSEEESKWAVYTQQMPYPCYRKDYFQTGMYESQALLVAFFFSMLYTVASAVRFMVVDKESGNTMLMSVMGVDLKYHTISWFIASFVEMTITCVCIAAVLCLGKILPQTTPSMVFALLFIFGISVLCFCYLVSKLFNTASFAAVCAAIAYLVTFMPIILILSLEAVMSSSYKIFVCLSMSSALCYSFLYIARYEAMGVGAHWSDFWSSPIDEGSDMSIGMAAGMMLLDAVLYLAIGWLIDRFFGPKTLRSNITNCVTASEKAGVSIVNITKVYNEGSRRAKLALDNVSIELHKGQITTLLGHNGAGKTTLIKILMGMLKPSKGHVTIRSGLESGTTLGVCPQKDVLFEYMTAREHIALYAQLKSGLPLDQVKDEVESLVHVLSLGSVSDEPVCRLSGGTRRRLCVALAFVARPQLVSLDEPTSGVDPAARRDIWSMIVKLREDRTILLTTHHLDEAELLSDQIVIMHKGQVHTTGSPIDIKRTLGTGYKLTVIYPKGNQEEPWLEDEDMTMEERTKQLLAVVRDVVKNASLADICGNEVEITLPFFDANGLNNNFLQLCTVLEMGQEMLAFNNYSMECSTLEQVFFNICREVDATHAIEYDMNPRGSEDTPSKSASNSSIRTDNAPLVDGDGPSKGTTWQQFLALMYGRFIHYKRNRWLLFLLIVLPSLFVTVAMSFSTIRPPADNEVSLRLTPDLYPNSTQFLVPSPSIVNSTVDPGFARRVMDVLISDQARNWTQLDSPTCKCTETRQVCEKNTNITTSRPEMMLLPDVHKLNEWIVDSHELYIEKRYGGFSSTLKNNITNLVAWYNNKGHHALPAFLNAVNVAVLRATTGRDHNITTYTHPLKISKEQISKDTVYQHIADAGISGLVLIAYSLVSAGSAIYLVSARKSQEKRLQLLCGVSPALYWMTALVWDMIIIIINMLITAIVMEAFHFPVFVERDNLPAICILILLFGYASSCLIHVMEKLFTEPSMANMILFCGGTFVGLAGIALLLILDVISQSDTTDNARRIMHKVFLLSPQFALADGMLEIAKNTIEAQVLARFGMDTYRGPFSTNLIGYHCLALVVVGTALLLLNLAIEYDLFEVILVRFRAESIPDEPSGEMEDLEVAAERKRVETAVHHAASGPVRLHTIGNINAGFVDTEVNTKSKSMKRIVVGLADVAQCVGLGKAYSALTGTRVAVRDLTLGIPYGQCTALLGQNGAGKSTTFSMLTGETRPTTGKIYLNDRPVNARDLCRGLISYCPQSDAIDPLLSVRETLAMYCKLRGITEENDVIRRTLDMFELNKYADMLSGALSGGNKRKLCAAIAFMGRSTLVLLDEPTSGTDPLSLWCVSRGVRRACASGRGVLLSTHALHTARRLAARVALMRRGRLCALAALDDCLQRFGGGYIVQCRGAPRALWRRLSARAPHARLRVLHHAALHVLIPTHATVNGKEVTTRVSDIFRLMSELQSTCDMEDYTINQSSLDQMFLSFTDKADMDLETVEVEPLPSPNSLRKNGEILPSPKISNGEPYTYPEISKIENDIVPEIVTDKKTHVPPEILRNGETSIVSPTVLMNGELQITTVPTSLEIVRKNSDPSPSQIPIFVRTSPIRQRRNSEELNSVTSL